jgi:hypothetical protein
MTRMRLTYYKGRPKGNVRLLVFKCINIAFRGLLNKLLIPATTKPKSTVSHLSKRRPKPVTGQELNHYFLPDILLALLAQRSSQLVTVFALIDAPSWRNLATKVIFEHGA